MKLQCSDYNKYSKDCNGYALGTLISVAKCHQAVIESDEVPRCAIRCPRIPFISKSKKEGKTEHYVTHTKEVK